MGNIATPSKAIHAVSRGFKVLNIFPADGMGGVKYLQAISSAYPGFKFIPTGGINAESLIAGLKLRCNHAVPTSWLVNPQLMNAGRSGEITYLASQAVENNKIARQSMEAK